MLRMLTVCSPAKYLVYEHKENIKHDDMQQFIFDAMHMWKFYWPIFLPQNEKKINKALSKCTVKFDSLYLL